MMKELIEVQKELKAPKNQKNSFGGYNYRSAEDILEAVKPLLVKNALEMTISDTIENIGSRYYIKATVTLVNAGGDTVTVSAYAREAETKKGMDDSQITGTASSYARKYALNGLFLIDDTKDADTNEYAKAGSAHQTVQKGGKLSDGEVKQIKALFDGGVFTEQEKEYWRNEYKKHPEWTGKEYITKLQLAIDRKVEATNANEKNEEIY